MADLINLTDLKKYLFANEATAPTDWDPILPTIISAVSRKVINEIDCDLLHTHYTSEYVSGTGRSDLPLKHWPISSVSSVTDLDGNAFTVGHDEDYTIEDFCLRSTSTWAKGHKNIIVSYVAGYAEMHSISAFANYGTTVSGTVLATSGAHGFAAGTTADVVISGTTNYNGTYTVTYVDANSFYFTATWVATETGYWSKPALPYDIILVCYEQAAQIFKSMKMNLQGESSRNFPDGSVAYSSVDGGFTKAQLAILSKYKRPNI